MRIVLTENIIGEIIMSEKEAIQKSKKPITKKSLIKDFKAGGLEKGATVIVHSSLNSLGWVCGGAVSLIEALMEVVTSEGTLVMPTHSGDYSDPKYWSNPPVPEEWYEIIRNEMPAYKPSITPTRGIGVVPEVFRQYPGVKRSDHPCLSFAAWGKDAEKIVSNHKLAYSMGEKSPLGDIYKRKGNILLIGVDHESNTSLHLAEYMADYNKEVKKFGSPVLKNGKRIWAEYEDIDFETDDFNEVAEAYEEKNEYVSFKLGQTVAKLFSQKDFVDFAVSWFEKNR